MYQVTYIAPTGKHRTKTFISRILADQFIRKTGYTLISIVEINVKIKVKLNVNISIK